MNTNRFTIRNAVLSVILLISFVIPFQTSAVEIDPGIKTFDHLEKAIDAARKQVEKSPEDCGGLNKLARLLFTAGNYDDAEKHLDRALEIKPDHVDQVESLLVLTELYWRKYKFEKACKYLDKAAALAPGNTSVRFLQAQLAEKKMDFKASEAIYRRLLEKDPGSVKALFGTAKIAYHQRRFDVSETQIQKCYKIDPEYAPPYLLHSKIHRMRQNDKEWKETARKAVELAPFSAEARIAHARALMRGKGNLKDGAEQAKIALKIDPYSVPAHHYLGRGYTAVPYKDYQPEGDKKTVGNINELYKKGDQFLVKGDYEKADRIFTSLLKLDPKHIRAIISKGAVHFHRKEYDAALGRYFQALKINPDYGLAHYGVTLVLGQWLDEINVRFPDLKKRFAKINLQEPPYFRDIFINYDECDHDLQKIIGLTVAPLSNYMKPLKIAGATVYFMNIHRFIWENPYMEGLKGQRTFDLRLWDDIKGVGGYHNNSNKAQQTGVKYLRFNVAGHEFAHLVQQILTPVQRNTLRRLYLKAKEERKTLDWYADMNDWEYFAVGYEAFVSEEKLPGQADVYAHTREELLKKDPDLYHFIDGLNRAADYRENEIMGFIMKAGNTSRDPLKRIEIFKEGLASYGDHPVLLNAMADNYRYRKQYEEAVKTYEKTIQGFPEDIDAYLEIAKDTFQRKRNTGEAIAFLKKHEARFTGNAGYYFHLGTLYYYEGKLEEMEGAFQKGLKLDPWPDIYSPNYFQGDPYYTMGLGLLAKEDYKGAEKNILISLEKLNRNFAGGWAELAELFLKTGRGKEGKKHLDTALRLQPDSPMVQTVQAAYLLKEGKKQGARDILSKVLEKNPRDIHTRLWMAEVLAEMGPGLPGARDVLAKGVELLTSGDNSGPRVEMASVSKLYGSLASVLEKMGKTDDAVKYHLTAVEKFKYNYKSLDALVKLYKQKGKEEKAREFSDKLKKAK